MTGSMCMAAFFLMASAVAQADQCSSGGECKSSNEPQSVVSLLQAKLQTNVLEESVEDAKARNGGTDSDPYEVASLAETIVLHIGKTGGMSLEKAFNNSLPSKVGFLDHSDAHSFVQGRISGTIPPPSYKDIVFFVRSPVHRFISAWLSRFRHGQPELFIPWSSGEKWAFETFPTPEDLACSLSSSDPDMVATAQKAMSSIYHVHLDIAWYLGGLSGAKVLASQILFVGATEHYSDDFLHLTALLDSRSSFIGDPPQEEHVHAVAAADMHLKKLSRCSVLNLHDWYSEDYQIIRFLATRGLLNKSYVDEVDRLDAAPIEGQHLSY